MLIGYPTHKTDYNEIWDNPGWIKGTKSAYSMFGAYMWLLQNKLTFKTSPSKYYTVNGKNFLIEKVYVGTLGDYAPTTTVSVVFPQVDDPEAYQYPDCPTLTSARPDNDYSETVKYSFDTKAYYKLVTPKIHFIRQTNTVIPSVGDEACLMVSKRLTSDNLPLSATFDGPSGANPDSDTFRVQVQGLPDGMEPQIKFDITGYSYSDPLYNTLGMWCGEMNGITTYRTKKFIRLVSNTVDGEYLTPYIPDCTPVVNLGDTVKVTLMLNGSELCSEELKVGRPASETGANAIRKASCNFIKVHMSDVTTYADVPKTIEKMNKTWAQAATCFDATSTTICEPVTNIIRLQNNAIGQSMVSLSVDDIWVPEFLVGAEGRRSPYAIAEDISNAINATFGADTAYPFNSCPLLQQAYVVVRKGQGAKIIFNGNIPSTLVFVNIIDFSDDIANRFDQECLVANYGDNNPDTIELFLCKYLPDGDRGWAWTPSITGADGEMRNRIFLALVSANSTDDNPFSAPHEAAHVLLDRDLHVDDDEYNLLHAPTTGSDVIYGTKRITSEQHLRAREVNDGKILRQ